EDRPQIGVHRQQGASEAVANGPRLTVWPTTGNRDVGVVAISQARGRQGLRRGESLRFDREIVLKRAAVDNNLTSASGQTHAGHSGFTASRPNVLRWFRFRSFDVGHKEIYKNRRSLSGRCERL